MAEQKIERRGRILQGAEHDVSARVLVASRGTPRERSHLMRCGIAFGGVFPDYLLADRPDTVGNFGAGQVVDLLIVTFARLLLFPQRQQYLGQLH